MASERSFKINTEADFDHFVALAAQAFEGANPSAWL